MTTVPENERRADASSPFTFAAINGWRGIGSIGIAIAHLEVISDFAAVRHLRPIIFLVDLFFVASGIIIAQSYGARLRTGPAVIDYAVRRFGRIWPLHAALLAILVAYELVKLGLQSGWGRQFYDAPFAPGSGTDPWAILGNVLLVQSLGFHARETWNFPSWSLSVEFVIYLVFAVFCLAGMRWCRILSFAAIVGSLLVLVLLAPVGMRSTFDYGMFRCAVGFFTGVLAYEAARAKLVPSWPWPTLVEIVVLTGSVVWMFFAEDTGLAFAAPVVFFILIIVFAHERGAVSRLLRHHRLQALADLSYAIYIAHAVVLMGFMAVVRMIAAHFHLAIFIPTPPELVPKGLRPAASQLLHVGSQPLEWAIVAVYAIIVVAVAFVGYRFVEVPSRRFFNQLARRLSVAAARPAAAPRAENGLARAASAGSTAQG